MCWVSAMTRHDSPPKAFGPHTHFASTGDEKTQHTPKTPPRPAESQVDGGSFASILFVSGSPQNPTIGRFTRYLVYHEAEKSQRG